MIKIEELLRQSVTQYQTIFDYIQAMASVFSRLQAPQEIENCCISLRSMLNEAQLIDTSINEFLEKNWVDITLTSLFQERQKLMVEVVKQNKLLFSQITGKMAVISAEISKVKAGRTAMTNYKTGKKKAGGLINTSL